MKRIRHLTPTFAATFALLAAVAVAAPANASPRVAGDAIEAPATTTTAGVALDDGNTVFTTEQSQLTVLPATGPEPSAAELATLAGTISCGLDVQWVHGSTHVAGTINGVAVVTCTAAAGSLTLHYSLIRVSPNYTQWGAGSVTNTGKPTIKNNRAVPCTQGPGEFRGWAQGVISPPAGYTLVGPATHAAYGDIKSVACGLSFAAESQASSPSETLSVTFVRSDLVGH